VYSRGRGPRLPPKPAISIKTWVKDRDFDKENISLYLTEAQLRDKMISEVKYDLTLHLTKQDWYAGRLQSEFRLQNAHEGDIFLDFHGQQITGMTVNGTQVTDDNVNFEGHRVYLPKYYLKDDSIN